jgi:hypothetical protein
MALQDPVNPASWMFVLKNNSDSPVTFFSVGMGHEPELRVSVLSVPLQVPAPAGWNGWFNIGDESDFIRWGWEAKNPGAAIPPGDFVSGFRVILPPFTERLKVSRNPDGTAVSPVKVAGLPYMVLLKGACVWGRVVPLIPGR